MRTLQDIKNDYEKAKSEAEPIIKAREEAVRKCNALYKEMEDYKIKHGLFNPISDLKNYEGKEIIHIKLVIKGSDGELSVKDMWNNELFWVDENGHLVYSSCECGTMKYDYKKCKYVYFYYGNKIEYDFIGYLDVCFYDDEECEPIE